MRESMQKIMPCLWFENQAEEAAKFYTNIFKNSKVGRIARYGESGAEVSGQKAGSVMTVTFEIEGFQIEGLNGGPIFKFTPAISFYVSCRSEDEIKTLWQKLSAGGTVRMGLDKYPWSDIYGWVADKYGVEWQLILDPKKKEKIVPALMFVDQLFGKGEEALKFYTSVFADGKIDNLVRDEKTNSVMFSEFSLLGQGLVLMDGQGTHNWTFSHATSLIVNCDDQAEVDKYWEKLAVGGSHEPCGWLRDKFGVSWQIVPKALYELMADPDPVKVERRMQAMLKMKKLDIATLKNA